MIAIFNPYHQFANIDLFSATFNNLGCNQRVSTDASPIPRYCTSVRLKLHHSKTHLESMLAIKKWNITPSTTPTVPPYVTTGSASNAAATIPTSVPPIQAMNLSLELDGFFESLTSALDIFAHIINLVYFAPPRTPERIGFDYIVGELTNDPARRNEPITQHLVRMKRNKWYGEIKRFRRCAIHYGAIDYEISYKPTSYRPLREYITSHDVRAIFLPDNPLSPQLSYQKKRSVQTLCVKILKSELDKLDIAFGLLETRVGTANQVPV